VWIIFFLQRIYFQKIMNYPLLVVSYFTMFIMSTSMEEILIVLRDLEHENQEFCEFVVHLQTNQASTSLGYILATQLIC